MPKYLTGNHAFYRDGVLTPAGDEVTVPDTVEPSRTWTALDAEGEAALEKLRKSDAERARLRLASATDVKGVDIQAIIAEQVKLGVAAELARHAQAAKPAPTPQGPAPKDDKGGKRPSDKSVF